MLVFVFIGCKDNSKVSHTATPSTKSQETAAVVKPDEPVNLQIPAEERSGIILTIMDSAGYTYMEVQENGEKVWVAVPQTAVKVGDQLRFPNGSMMSQFHSKTLNRTFDKILFVSRVSTPSSSTASGKRSPFVKSDKGYSTNAGNQTGIPAPKVVPPPDLGSIAKIEGGYTVEELFSKKKELNGKEVKVRGKVVKVMLGVMGKNWVHIQDGSGAEGTNDIIFTSGTETAQVGSLVVAQGMLAADKDFGAGYLYSAIVENSTFIK